MLDQAMKQQLKAYLENVKTQVQLVLSLDDLSLANSNSTASKIESLANDIASLSSKIDVVRDDAASQRKPVMRVVNPEKGTAIGFAGLPMGHEFPSLVLALRPTRGHPIKPEAETI